ncbi:hypothetical protein ACJ41O_014318 [Fusarium nematophilum]
MPAPNSMIEMNGALNACGHDPGSNVPGSFLGADNEQDARILEAMDRLRELGVDRQYDLPQIIVCGAQSAGKSSVLESIVQIPFPRSDKTCTKYATKVTIVRNPTISVAVKIQPDRGRPTDEIKRLRAFERAAKGQEGGSKLGKFMAEAHIEIFAGSAAGKLITRDVLLVTISAPNHRPLQLLDLPGLIEYDHMNLGNEAEIRGMVEEYMRMKQSMILAVVKATDDINNQKVLTLCRDHDREGTRTLGIITRPDVAEIGQADALIQVIEGNDPDFRFKHGWHVLRNRNNQELLANTTQAQRNCAEKALFERYPWNRVSEPNWGIENLIARLRRMLFSVSKRELPALRKTFLDRVYHLQKEYADLGGDEFSDVELGHGFKRAIGRLRKATRDHSNGEYRSDIHKYPPESPIRLRSRIVDQDEIFHDKLYRDGHTWKTLIRPSTSGIESTSKAATQTRYKDLAAEVTEVTRQLQRSRGTELPGFLNPKRINDLFWQMSDGWNAITEEHIGDIYQCCETYFNTITPVVFKPTTGSSDGFSNAGVVAARFVRLCIIPQLEKSRENATDELQKLENDRLSFTRNVDVRFLKDSRRHHQQRDFRRAVRAVHEIESLSQGEAGSLDHNTYARHSGLFSEQQHDEDVAETYLDAMWSHYLRDTLAGSRFHSDRAEYREAATLLRDFPKTATDRLEAVLELARVIKTQGYCRDPLSILLDEVLPTPDGAMDLRFQQVSRVLKKDHRHLTDELLEELKGYFVKYEVSDAIAAYQIAIQAFLAHIPLWLAFELQIALNHERDELAHRLADTVVFTASASRWQSIIIYTGRERGWVAGDQALAALEDAENARAVERADMTALASFEAVSHRQHFTSLKGLSETYQRPLRGCEFEGRISELWEWTQKAKPRSMSDQLGVDSLVPAGLRGQAIRDPGRRELMEEAEALSFRIAESPASVRLRLRGELELIHKQMAKDALLKAVIDIKNGTPVTSDQIQQLGIQMKRSCPGRDVKFVDWLEPSNKLWVLVLGCEKKTPGVMQCPVSPAEVAAWKREWLDAQPGEIAAFEKDDFYSEDDPEFSLCSLDGLVAPLDEFTKPGDLVVFCPTGVLHSIPLHALYVPSKLPVIKRNPVVYSVSLTTFWQCCRRGGWSELGSGQRPASFATQWTITSVLRESSDRLFDIEEQGDVYSLISNPAATANAQAVTGANVTKHFVLEAMQNLALFHFHGHGVFDCNTLADQSLEVADGSITVRDMFKLKLKAPHMIPIACNSASQGVAAGDEPLGIVTALLCAGAGSVLGTIWPTASRTGRYFTNEFYTNSLEKHRRRGDTSTDVGGHAAVIDLAEVSQRVVLALRRNIDTTHPYHWAAFVLRGSWFMNQKEKEGVASS